MGFVNLFEMNHRLIMYVNLLILKIYNLEGLLFILLFYRLLCLVKIDVVLLIIFMMVVEVWFRLLQSFLAIIYIIFVNY
jgi:hypothetical protein